MTFARSLCLFEGNNKGASLAGDHTIIEPLCSQHCKYFVCHRHRHHLDHICIATTTAGAKYAAGGSASYSKKKGTGRTTSSSSSCRCVFFLVFVLIVTIVGLLEWQSANVSQAGQHRHAQRQPLEMFTTSSHTNIKEKDEEKTLAVFSGMKTIAFLSFTLLPFAEAAELPQASARNDPRCKDFNFNNCPSIMIPAGLARFSRLVDQSSCKRLGNCSRCLNGSVWRDRLGLLGLGRALRTFSPYVWSHNWLSHEVVSTIVMILLREAMGFDALGVPATSSASKYFACCPDDPMMDFERWSNIPLEEINFFTLTALPVGYEGQSGLFVPKYMLEQYPLATAYGAYKHLDAYKHMLPRAFSTNCTDVVVDKTLNASTCNISKERTVCDTNEWPLSNNSCQRGRYVPPQCNVSDFNSSTHPCQEIFHPDPTYDDGIFESIIRTNGLNMTVTYTSVKSYQTFLKDRYAARQNMMFYWWTPDPLTAALDAQLVNFDPVTSACLAARQTWADPTALAGKCGYPVTTLQKIGFRAQIERDVDLKHFFENFKMREEDMIQMLRSHISAAGNRTVFEASCDWVQNNYNTWSAWTRNTAPPAAAAAAIDKGFFEAWMIAVPIATTVLVVLCCAVAFVVCARLQNRHAPTHAPVAVLFTDIESSTALWEACGPDMRLAVDAHNTIIRQLIADHQAYEVKTNGDSFMIACGRLADAAMLAVAIQSALQRFEGWPASIDATYARLAGAEPDIKTISSEDNPLTNRNAPAEIAPTTDVFPPTLTSTEAPTTIPAHGDDPARNEGCGDGVHPNGLWSGLRVRIGLHWCHEVIADQHPITKRFDYLGHDVNVAARVEAHARGGQVLVNAATEAELRRCADFLNLAAEDCVLAPFALDVALKGVTGLTSLHALAPVLLSGRRFLPIPGTRAPPPQREGTAPEDDPMVVDCLPTMVEGGGGSSGRGAVSPGDDGVEHRSSAAGDEVLTCGSAGGSMIMLAAGHGGAGGGGRPGGGAGSISGTTPSASSIGGHLMQEMQTVSRECLRQLLAAVLAAVGSDQDSLLERLCGANGVQETVRSRQSRMLVLAFERRVLAQYRSVRWAVGRAKGQRMAAQQHGNIQQQQQQNPLQHRGSSAQQSPPLQRGGGGSSGGFGISTPQLHRNSITGSNGVLEMEDLTALVSTTASQQHGDK